jgi:hypothetical protein
VYLNWKKIPCNPNSNSAQNETLLQLLSFLPVLLPHYLISPDRVVGRDVETESQIMRRSDKETEIGGALVPH